MALQIGTVDGLINLASNKLNSLIKAISLFPPKGIEIANELGISIGAAFQRFTEPVYKDSTKSFDFNSLSIPVLTRTGNEQSPARVTYCKKMGLLNINIDTEEFSLTPIGEALNNSIIRFEEYAFLLMSKQGIFKNGVYTGHLLPIIGEWFTQRSSITEEDLRTYILAKFNDVNIEKTRIDILLNALCFCNLLNDLGDGKKILCDITSARILEIFMSNEQYLTPAILDNADGYVDYIGGFSNGIFDITNNNNASLIISKYPGLKNFIKHKDNPNMISVPTVHLYRNCPPSKYVGNVSPIILYGPPGTGKTHSLQKDYVENFDERLVAFTTFHQSFSYEEFVEGLKPILDDNANDDKDVKYQIEKGVFYRICEKAAEVAGYNGLKDCIDDDRNNRKTKFNQAIQEKKLVLLCIDEINRGNVASIFGDLISLIEPSKRLGAKHELTLTLPYSKQKFGVPANLVIVGTMNTADRSIQLLDTALRRRFRFKECPPNYNIITNDTAKEVLKRINARIRSLLNKDNQIGHSYFMETQTNVEILEAISRKVIPLLEEYFYNNVDKIKFILNDVDEKSDVHFYIEDKDAKEAAKKFSTIDIDTEEADFYELDQNIYEIKEEEEAEKYLKLIIGK